jgi:hypothetical protein
VTEEGAGGYGGSNHIEGPGGQTEDLGEDNKEDSMADLWVMVAPLLIGRGCCILVT